LAEGIQGRIIVDSILAPDRDSLLAALDTVRARRPEAAVMLLGADEVEAKVTIVAAVPQDAISAGLKAGDWVKQAAQACGGSGGGKPDRAQAGGKEPAKMPQAIAAAKSYAENLLAG
jgi:alanyl-tRNA synthetase